MINMDKPEYQELAQYIEVYHDEGYGWPEAQALALRDMWRINGWKPIHSSRKP
jgi:hypothetical protein